MTTHDEEDKRNRSDKLCQLVYDRQLDSDIGIEIRKLLEEGVLIDFQDPDRNRKTALHLAVDKCDVICVKFLLRYKPDLEVKDGDGKTPVELAKSNGCENILNVLMNSTVDSVNESYVEVIDYESLTPQKIEAIKSRPTFKVLKLTNCPSVNTVLEKITHHAYATTFSESSHLFFIAIATNEANLDNDHDLTKKVFNMRRPMIVQLTSASSQNTKIYFKDQKKDFEEIPDTPQMTQEEFNKSVESECNMKLLVAALRSNLFGYFTGNLLDTKLNTNESRSEAVNQFAKSNALCHRFFKLFDENLVDESQAQIDRILATLSFKGDKSLLALLDLPFETKDKKLKLTESQQYILSVVDDRDYNLLMLAVELNNLDGVKLLLRCGCDFNRLGKNGYRASDICWEVDAFDCLAELIEAGSPYPYHFATDELDESSEAQRINKMIETTNSFHKHIEDGNIEEIRKFIARHPHIKHAYDTKNFCALIVALESGKFEIYSLLMSVGFEPGADDEYESALYEFSNKNKNKIRKSHRKYFKEVSSEPHLMRLVEKSKLSFGSKDRATCSAIIRKMFDELNEIDEVIPILQICSLSEKLRIVFDFNCDYVVDMVVETGSRSRGIVYSDEGSVYIGARNHKTELYKVVGALVHELTHYAMKLTYENSCKPFHVGDIESANRFEAIAIGTKKICDENPSTDSIITKVFRKTLYGEGVWHAELIVRVPQLLAMYKMNPKVLEAAERNTPELFHFYREKTLKDIAAKSEVLFQKYLIGKINKQTGIARKIRSMNVHFEKVVIHLKPSAYVITSNAPQLTLAMLTQEFLPISHIFVTLEQVAIGNVLDKIAKVNAKESSITLIVDCIGQTQKYQESLQKLMTEIENIKTIALVMTEAESSKVKENFPEFESETFNHKWAELTESSKVHLLDQNVIFQGVEIKLNELVDPSSEAMNFFPLGELVDCKDFKVGRELHKPSHKFYIPRQFIKKGQEDAKSFEELFRVDSKLGSMIISDDAGSGKSVALIEVAKSLHGAFPDRWIQFVDLKRHIEAFKLIEDHEKIESFEDFIMQNVLKNEPKFDRELFVQMFRDGKTFILFDGFDEISPNYKDLLLHVLTLFDAGSGNQLFITTRPHLEADLEGALGEFVFKLEEFSKESQKSFLRDYWRSVGLEMSQEDFEFLSNRLLKKFSKIAASNIGLPLLMRMTAEIFDDSSNENLLSKVDSLSIASVFRQFVEKYLMRWTNNENEISRNETVEFQMAGGVLEVHYIIALNHRFKDKFVSFEVDEDEAEKIARVGLIRYDKIEKSFQFIHQTFAEYFVADFIWLHLDRKNRNPRHYCSMAIEVLFEVVCDLNFDFRIIRTFLDQILEAMNFSPNEAFCKSVAKCLSEVLKSRNRFDILYQNLYAWREHLACLLLSIAKHVEKEILLKVLKSKGTFTDSVLLDAAEFGSKAVVSTLCDIITNCTDNPKETYQHEDKVRGNVLLCAAHNKNFGFLSILCTNLNSVLTRNEIKVMLQQKDYRGHNIITEAAYNRNDVIFLELISLLPKYLSPGEIKNLLQEVDDDIQNFFHRALTRDTSERAEMNFEVIKLNFDVEAQKTYFYQAPNMFHCASRNNNYKIFETIIESTRDVLSNDEIKSMLMQKNSKGSNVLHIIAAHGNEVSLNELNLLLRERLADDEIGSLLLEVNKKGQNCFRLAANNAKLNFQVFCETIGSFLSTEDQTRLLQQSIDEIDIVSLACGNYTNEILSVESIKELLTRRDKEGRNAFLKVADDGDVAEWKKLISFAQARFSADEMKNFLFCIDNDGSNCLHHAIYNISRIEKMIGAICRTIKNVGWSVEDQKKFVRQNDSKKRNVFHVVAERDNSLNLNYLTLFSDLSPIISNDEIKEMLKEKDSEGNNILCTYSNNYDFNFNKTGSMADLIEFMKENLTNDEIKNLFIDVNHKGHNFFHCAIQSSTSIKAIKSLSEAIKEILSRDDQKKFFDIKSPNVFHLVAESFKVGMFSTLHECLKDVLTKDEIKSLIQEKNSENKNILLLICRHRLRYDDVIRLRDFFKFLKVASDADESKNILKSSDNAGNNCLLLAAQFQDQSFLKEFFSFVQSELSADEQRELIQKFDNDGKNIFTCASLNRDKAEIFPLVEQLARKILSKSQIEEMMMQMRQFTDTKTDSSDTSDL